MDEVAYDVTHFTTRGRARGLCPYFTGWPP